MQSDSNLTQSSRLSIGDYIPNALVESSEHRLDIQVKAGEPNIFIVIKRSHTALAQGAAHLKLPYRHFVIKEEATKFEHSRLFASAELSSRIASCAETFANNSICLQQIHGTIWGVVKP